MQSQPSVRISEPVLDEDDVDNGDDNNQRIHSSRSGRGNRFLTLVPKRQRFAVSMRDDDTDAWGVTQLDDKDEHTLVLRDPNVRSEMLERMNTFRRNRELCDVVLFVKGHEFLAHKVVLAAQSPFLCDLFSRDSGSVDGGVSASSPSAASAPIIATADNNNSTPRANGNGPSAATAAAMTALNNNNSGSGGIESRPSYFELNNIDRDSFAALIEFAYAGCLEISSRKVGDLYKTAYQLGMQDCAEACARYLADHLSVANCVGIRRAANFHGDSRLVDLVDSYISENVADVVSDSVEFTQLPCIKTRVIIRLERAQLWGARRLAEKALNYFQSLRTTTIDELTARTHILYVEEDERLVDCAELDDRSSVGSCDLVRDYKKSTAAHHHLPSSAVLMAVTTTDETETGAPAVRVHRTGSAQHHSAPVHKGDSQESLESYETTGSSAGATSQEDEIESQLLATHHTSGDFWVALVVLHRRLVVLSMQLTEDDELFATNGRSGAKEQRRSSNDQEKERLLARLLVSAESSAAGLNNRQQPLATMRGARCAMGAVFVAGRIVVCGGYDRGECLRSVEEYEPQGELWRGLPSMLGERGRFDTAVLGGKVYAVAGSNGNNDLCTAEVLDLNAPAPLKWTEIAKLPRARSHNGCTSLAGYVYTLGGVSDQTPLADCLKYSPASNEWTPIASLPSPRYQMGVITWRGLVIAAGGCDRWACLDSVVAYDPTTNAWRELAKLRTPRRGCAVAVFRDSLYVIGGHDGQQALASCEVLESPGAQWRVGPQLNTERANTHAVVTAGQTIYVIGGFSGQHFLNSVELLDNESVGWRGWRLSKTPPNGAIAEEEGEDESSDAVSSSCRTSQVGHSAGSNSLCPAV